MEIARGGDARAFLEAVPDDAAPDLDPASVAHTIFYSAPRTLCREVEHWLELWPQVEANLGRFLAALEQRARASGLARRAARRIERLVLAHAGDVRPLKIGATQAVRIEVAAPLAAVAAPAGVERLHCALTLEGEPLGEIELPVCDGFVAASLLADAIAAEHAWPILGRFFERTVYRELASRDADGRSSLVRGETPVGEDVRGDTRPLAERAHASAGWTVFLQELWGHPQWPRERFFAKEAPKDEPSCAAPPVRARDHVVCELSAELPDVVGAAEQLDVVPTVGGAALGVVRVPTHDGRVGADRLRAAIIAAAGMELCRAAVREAIVGRSLDAEPVGLRERLGLAAGAVGRNGAHADAGAWEKPIGAELLHLAHAGAYEPGPGPGIVLARRYADAIGTSASRRAALPGASVAAVSDNATASGELVLHQRGPSVSSRVAYVPEVVSRPSSSIWRSLAESARSLLARERAPAPQRPPESGDRETTRVPILMYHRIAGSGAPATWRYRVTPDAFARQLAVLRDAGYRSLDLDEWRDAVRSRHPLAGRPVVLTFDDGHADFATEAWPLLERFGFSAIVFLVADRIGATAAWEAMRGEEPPLLGWEAISELAAKGIVFGSHSASHARLTGLDPVAATDELARSRAILSRGLGRPVDAIAYPHGAQDAVVRHLAGACGYTFGFTCEPALAGFDDSLLALPRVEVHAGMDIDGFRAALGAAATGAGQAAQ
jgi:peptidoglycan/xylan/chitin deacetylase (PgdA/CDA1 family)